MNDDAQGPHAQLRFFRRVATRFNALTLKPDRAAKVLTALLTTAGAQFAMILTLQSPIHTLFGTHADAIMTLCSKGSAFCAVALGAMGFVLALSHSLTDASKD